MGLQFTEAAQERDDPLAIGLLRDLFRQDHGSLKCFGVTIEGNDRNLLASSQ